MKRIPRLALAAALFAGALTGIPSLAFAGNLPAAIDGSVAVMHTNDIHGSYKYSYNASKVPALSALTDWRFSIALKTVPPIFCSMRAIPSTGSPLPP